MFAAETISSPHAAPSPHAAVGTGSPDRLRSGSAAEGEGHFPAPPRPLGGSHTIQHADGRTRALAEAMVKLNAEGGCTEEALLREGFSPAELRHHSAAATALANGLFVRSDRTAEEVEPLPVRMARDIVAGVGRDSSAVVTLQRRGYTGAEIAAHLDAAHRIADRQLATRLKLPPNARLTELAYAVGRMVAAHQAAEAGAARETVQ